MSRQKNMVSCMFAAVAITCGLGISSVDAALKDNNCQSGEVCWFNSTGTTGQVYDNDNGSDTSLSSGTSAYYSDGTTATDNSFNKIWSRIASGYVQGWTSNSYGGTNATGSCVGPGITWTLAPINAVSSHRSRTLGEC